MDNKTSLHKPSVVSPEEMREQRKKDRKEYELAVYKELMEEYNDMPLPPEPDLGIYFMLIRRLDRNNEILRRVNKRLHEIGGTADTDDYMWDDYLYGK